MANVLKPKRSNVAGNIPTTTNLASGEMGVNMADRKVWINNGTSVVQIGAGRLSGLADVVLSSLATGQGLSWNGTNWVNSSAGAGSVTSVSGTGTVSGLTLTGSVTSSGSLTLGGTLSLTSGQVTTALGFTPANATQLTAGVTQTNFDAIKAPGLYQYDGTMTSTPNGRANYRAIEIGSNGRYSQIALPWDQDGMWFRRHQDSTWGTWREVLHSGNFSSYAPSLSGTYADPAWITSLASSKLTGTIDNARLNGGTYTINVTGNAGTATTLQTSRTINGIPFNGSAAIDTTEWFHSDRDFPNGTLITTNINYAVTNGDPFVLEIRGNSYGNIVPLDLLYQGYIYADTIINHGGVSNGLSISGLVAINNGGNLCFWFPSQGYWNGYNVKVYAAYATRATNRVTSITGVAKPTTAKEVALSANIRQALHSGNFTSYSPSLTGSGASGTWGINVTGNAGTATALQTARTINGVSFNGTANITITAAANGGTAANITGQANSATITASTGVNASQIVQRDGNGYIYANHINFSTSESENPTINSFITGNGDGWSRKSSLAHVKNSIRGVADGTWGISVTGSAGSAAHLPTAYIGGQRLNPQTYFNSGIGVKVAMTAAAGVWSDTLWINGYSGGDVLQMCALHFQRNGTPRMYISNQASTATSYGTLYEVLTSFNVSSYALSASGGTINGNGTLDFGPNSSWGATLRIGGNGHTGATRASVVTTNGNLHLDGSTNNGVYLGWYNSGNAGTFFGNGAAGQVGRVDGSGNATFSGNVSGASDERLKTDWEGLPADYIERLAKVKSGTYTRLDSGDRQAGASAQDMQKLLKETVMTADDEAGTLSLAYGNAALVSAIELAKDNVDLRARVAKLEALVSKLIEG